MVDGDSCSAAIGPLGCAELDASGSDCVWKEEIASTESGCKCSGARGSNRCSFVFLFLFLSSSCRHVIHTYCRRGGNHNLAGLAVNTSILAPETTSFLTCLPHYAPLCTHALLCVSMVCLCRSSQRPLQVLRQHRDDRRMHWLLQQRKLRVVL